MTGHWALGTGPWAGNGLVGNRIVRRLERARSGQAVPQPSPPPFKLSSVAGASRRQVYIRYWKDNECTFDRQAGDIKESTCSLGREA